MWSYSQSDGWMSAPNGIKLARGYSGAVGPGKNNPAYQNVVDVGPIPCGTYAIEAPVDTVTHGPYVLALVPEASNQMFGRSAFRIHGDSVIEAGTASNGCIIMPKFARERIWESSDHVLAVV